MENRRKYSRIHFTTAALLLQQQQHWPCSVLDLSLKGVLLTRPEPFVVGDDASYQLTFNLDEHGTGLHFDMQLVRADDDTLGFIVTHADIDTATHLKRLIELNIGDDALLHRELDQLVHEPADLA